MTTIRTENAGSGGTDRRFLTDRQYRNGRNLEARRAIYAHIMSGGDFVTPVIDALRTAGAGPIVDVGDGPGVWHDTLRDADLDRSWLGFALSFVLDDGAAVVESVVGPVDAARRRAQVVIDRDGHFTVRSHPGLFLAHAPS